jgi:hypothetical protein
MSGDQRTPMSVGAVLRAKLTHVIEQHGFAVTGSPEPQEIAPDGMLYTVGLWEKHKVPELIVMGLPPLVAYDLLNDVHREITRGFLPADGLHLPDGVRPHDVLFRRVHGEWLAVTALVGQALNYYRTPVPFLQAVWPDADGRFPHDPGCVPQIAEAQLDLSQWHEPGGLRA